MHDANGMLLFEILISKDEIELVLKIFFLDGFFISSATGSHSLDMCEYR
jgi:hypothetical protein